MLVIDILGLHYIWASLIFLSKILNPIAFYTHLNSDHVQLKMSLLSKFYLSMLLRYISAIYFFFKCFHFFIDFCKRFTWTMKKCRLTYISGINLWLFNKIFFKFSFFLKNKFWYSTYFIYSVVQFHLLSCPFSLKELFIFIHQVVPLP